MLRLKALHDEARGCTEQLRVEIAQQKRWIQTLEDQLQSQVQTLKRLGLLKRFLPLEVAELLVSPGGATRLRGCQREIAVVCVAIEGFTAFVDTAATATVFEVLRTYHREVGHLAVQRHGILEYVAGDGIVVMFNDALTSPELGWQALETAVSIREALTDLRDAWHASGYALDFGIGVSSGNAKLGVTGFESRSHYAVMGSVRESAWHLCQEARGGRILVSPQLWAEGDVRLHAHPTGEYKLDGQIVTAPVFEVREITGLSHTCHP